MDQSAQWLGKGYLLLSHWGGAAYVREAQPISADLAGTSRQDWPCCRIAGCREREKTGQVLSTRTPRAQEKEVKPWEESEWGLWHKSRSLLGTCWEV